MPARNLKKITPVFWIPPQYTANFKITVEKGGVEEDVTDDLIYWQVEDGVTEGIGNFEFEIPNPNETYTNKWTGMEIFRYYCDYASTPTTLRFRGRLERPSKRDSNVRVSGQSESLFVFNQKITASYSDTDGGAIVKDLFDTYGEGRFDTSSIPASTGELLNVDFVDKPFWEAVQDVCVALGYDCYVDCNLVVRFFEQGSVNNADDAIVHDHNMFYVRDFAPDAQFIKNKVRVYGSKRDGVQIMYTANDAASQSTYGIRTEVVTDDSIESFEQAQELAEFLLAELKDPPAVGEVKGVLLASVQPGENVRLSSPIDNLPPAYYRTVKYVSRYDQNEGFTTTLTVNKEPRQVSHLIKRRIEADNRKQGVLSNPEDLDFAHVDLFSEDSGSHSNTEVSNGVLQKEAAGTNGVWTSQTIDTPNGNNIIKAFIDVNGDNVPGMTFRVSANNGGTWESVTLRQLKNLSSSVGDRLKIEVTLVDDDARVNSLSVQYNTA
jgi:hypothetical protein